MLTVFKCCSDYFIIQEVMRLSFYSQPDGPVMGNGSFNSSLLVPGYVLFLKYIDFSFFIVYNLLILYILTSLCLF